MKILFLIFIILVFLIQCNFNSMISGNIGMPESKNSLSIYANSPPPFNVNPTPYKENRITVNELFNEEYAYYGSFNDTNVLFVFAKLNGKPAVYTSSIYIIYNEPIYKMYQNRSLIPVYFITNGDYVMGMSIKPIFYKIDYDNFIGTNFSFYFGDVLKQSYATNILPARYPIRRKLSSDVGKNIDDVILPINELKRKISGDIWYSVENIDSKYPLTSSLGLNYRFLSNNEIVIEKTPGIPGEVPSYFKGWDIWSLKDIGKNYFNNYVYVYDYVEITVELQGDNHIMFLYNTNWSYGSIIQPSYRLIRLSTKP